MIHFKVRRFRDGIWDGKMPIRCTAETPQEAAERVCAITLRAKGTSNALRAEVWKHGAASRRVMFYEPTASEVRQPPP